MSVKGSEKGICPRSETGNFSAELKDLQKQHLLREPVCITSSHEQKIKINGRTLIDFSSNDYLGLSSHPGIIKAASKGLAKYGFGTGASRLLSGTYESHIKLEESIAKFKSTEAALLFNTGYAANTGIIPVIAGEDSVIFSDELNHASIVDGARLARAEVKIYRHRDMDHLESLLEKYHAKKSITKMLIITDTVFSMDGDIAPLDTIYSLCKKYGALLMTDDAHGTGVLGKTGRGGLEHFAMKPGNIIQMGTLSKSAGCFGAYVAGKKDLVKLLMNRSRSFIYSTSLPPAVAEASLKAVSIIDRRSAALRKRLWRNRNMLFDGLNKIGFDTSGSETPIIPVMVGDASTALKIAGHLYDNNIFAPAIRPPTVPENNCRIRFSVTAAHTKEDIEALLKSLKKYRS